ncbi:MAG: transglutaminase domain-containing protein [Clostridia bacterium]
MRKNIILITIFTLVLITLLCGCSLFSGDNIDATKPTNQLSVTIDQSEFVYDGTEKQPTPVVKYKDTLIAPASYNITYTNNINAGTASMTINIDCDAYKGSKDVDFTILPKSIGHVSITMPTQNYQYTGNPILPVLNSVLSKDTAETEVTTTLTTSDYLLESTNNINVGSANFTLTGQNNYNGSVEFEFNIIKRDLSTLSASSSPSIFTFAAGEVFTPDITQIKESEEVLTLIKDTDYTLSYANNDAIGIASIIVQGKGTNCDETTSFTVEFEITTEMIYHVAFHDVNNESFETISKVHNDYITKPDDKPLNKNQTIVWYEDANHTLPFYFDKMPIIDNATFTMTLYGQWEDEQGLSFFDNDYTAGNIAIDSREELVDIIDYLIFKQVTSEIDTTIFHLTYCNNTEREDEINWALDNRIYPTMKLSTHMSFSPNTNGDITLYFDAAKSIYEPNKNSGEPGEYEYTQLDSINNTNYNSERAIDYDDFYICNQEQIQDTISTSNQLYFTLEYGLKPLIEVGSTAERIYDKMKIVLREIVDDRMSDYEKASAIYKWLVMNVTYDYKALTITHDNDPNLTVNDPDNPGYYNCYYLEGVFDDYRAVCDGISKAYTSLCQIEGINCVRVIGLADHGGSSESHAWNKVKINNQWYVVDATWGNTGVTSNKIEYLNFQHFLTSTNTKLNYDCIANKYNNIECLGDYNYYYFSSYLIEDKNQFGNYYIENQSQLNDLIYYAAEKTINALSDCTINFYITFDYGASISDEMSLAETNVLARTGETLPNFSWSIPANNNNIITIIF